MPKLANLEALAEQAEGTSGSFVSSVDVHFEPLLDLPPARPEAPFLTEELLPPALRLWNVDAAERMQVPLEFTAVPAVVALAAVVGRRVGIRPKAHDDWLVVPNLWGGIIARPSMLKSPALKESLKPIHRLASDAAREHKQRLLDVGVKLETLQAEETAIKNLLRQAYQGTAKKCSREDLEARLRSVRGRIGELKEGLVERRYITNDTTVEKLGEIFAVNPRGVLLERDELAGWLRSLERDDRKSDREFYLEAWNGDNPYTYDRIGRGTIHIPALCLSIVGGIQPTKLARFVSDALDGSYASDGLLQRFQLLVWPEDTTQWRLVDKAPDVAARQAAYTLFSAVDQREFRGIEEGDAEVPALRFSADAQELFYEWLTQLQDRLGSPELKPYPAFESHLAKYRSLMPSLALLFHLAESIGRSEIGPVSLEAAKSAADWCDYLEQHARKVYAPEIGSEIVAAHALATKIRKKAIYDGMKVRDICRAKWSGLTDPEVAYDGLSLLEKHGWLAIEVIQGKGRPSQQVRLNPARTEVR